MKEHKFDNCTAWAKGWYAYRPNVKAWWMDIAHCINNDGWCGIQTKTDVVRWILNRFDSDQEWWKKNVGNFGFGDIFESINKYKNWYYNDENLSTEDCIILYFKNCLSIKDRNCFTGGFRPSNQVLPLRLHEAYYNDGYYNNGQPTYEPAEMMCDALERINKSFYDMPEQEFKSYQTDYIEIESSLLNKNYTDVSIPIGYDSDANIIKTYTGNNLTNKTSIKMEDITTEYGEPIWANMGIFSHSIGFDADQNYKVFIQKTKGDWGYQYLVKNIIKD